MLSYLGSGIISRFSAFLLRAIFFSLQPNYRIISWGPWCRILNGSEACSGHRKYPMLHGLNDTEHQAGLLPFLPGSARSNAPEGYAPRRVCTQSLRFRSSTVPWLLFEGLNSVFSVSLYIHACTLPVSGGMPGEPALWSFAELFRDLF